MTFKRYALYYTPPTDTAWGQFCTKWLGWDMATGHAVAHPNLPNLPLPIAEITATPRKYGLHATIKPPFALAPGQTLADLQHACGRLCCDLAPITLPGLALTRMGRFLALCPIEPHQGLNALAARCVRDLDRFRAPAAPAELQRRRRAGLTPQQESNLLDWGYPFVMDAFRFHITLSGRLSPAQGDPVETALHEHLAPLLPVPFPITGLSLAGEDDSGRFHLLHPYDLSGKSNDIAD